MLSLKKVISGGQTGADEAGLYTAKKFGFQTGGFIPKGYKTLAGPRPEFGVKYGLSEHTSDSYSARTIQNVKDSDATVRLAANFDSRGELCTLNAIKTYNKPYLDIDLTDPPTVEFFADWLEKSKISVLNVAGNSEQTFSGCFSKCVKYLTETFFLLGNDWLRHKKHDCLHK